MTVLEGDGRVEPLPGSKTDGATGVGEGAVTGATPPVGEDLFEERHMLILCIVPAYEQPRTVRSRTDAEV